MTYCFRMNAVIIVLALFVTVWCGPHSQQRHNPFGALATPYLRNVTMDARREFFRILSTTNETIAKQGQDVLTWGEKYGVLVGLSPRLDKIYLVRFRIARWLASLKKVIFMTTLRVA